MEKQIYKAPEGSKIVSVTTDNNRVVIELEKECFEPKDGDFVKFSPLNGFNDGFGIYAGSGNSLHVAILDNNISYDLHFGYSKRFLTEREKQALLDALAKNGKRWNAEKKCIEKVRGRAEKGSCYWSALNLGKFEPISISDTYDDMDNGRYESGNYFLTESDCQRLCDKLNEIVKNFE